MLQSLSRNLKILIGDVLIKITAFFAIKSANTRLCCFLFRIYKKILSYGGLTIMPILSFDKYCNVHEKWERTSILSNRKGVSVCSNSFITEDEPRWKDLRDIYMTICNDVVFSGDTDIIISSSNNCVINDFCYNKSKNILSSDSLLYRELNNWALIRRKYKSAYSLRESGIMLSGKFSTNYYHNLFENLNRVILLGEVDIPSDVPLLVDSYVLKIPSLIHALNIMLKGTEREIVGIDSNIIYRCKKLYYLDHLNYLIPHHKQQQIISQDVSYYDVALIKKQREIFLSKKSNIITPNRIFLTRSNSKIRNFNETEIYEILRLYGFEMVSPEKYTFVEQIAMFNNADCIIGGSGAAFSNLLFCRAGCKVLCFRAVKEDIGTPIFKSLAWINKVDFWHYPADMVKRSRGVHSNYYVNPMKFKCILNELIPELANE